LEDFVNLNKLILLKLTLAKSEKLAELAVFRVRSLFFLV